MEGMLAGARAQAKAEEEVAQGPHLMVRTSAEGTSSASDGKIAGNMASG